MGSLARFAQLWFNLRASLWFLPALIVAGAVGLAVLLIEAEHWVADDLLRNWPRLFGAGAEGSRSLLGAVASSMITVAGVVFSITVVVITLAASQYGSRVLRSFMRDRINQAVLGMFVGVFVYCLVVVRTISGGENAFVPSVAVFGGLALALVAIAFLIFFIHHITLSVQAAHILAAISGDTLAAIDTLYPEPDGPPCPGPGSGPGLAGDWHPVPARRSGYVQRIDTAALVTLAAERQAVIRVEKGVGEFLVEGLPALSFLAQEVPGKKIVDRAESAISVGRQRTVEQDPGFGIRQIVDVALKALSPGINDTTTAVMCLDYLTVILLRLGQRRIECEYRDGTGAVRVVTGGPTFEDLLGLSLDQIRQNADGNVAVLGSLTRCLEILAGQVAAERRQAVLREQALAVGDLIRRSVFSPLDRQRLDALSAKLMDRLGEKPAGPGG